MSKTDRVTPSTTAAMRQLINNVGFDSKADYSGFRTSPSDRFTFSRIGRLVDVNNESNTGTVFWLDQPGSRDEVPIAHPYMGLRGRIMAMPEVNSLVIVGFLHGIRPYILGYLPFDYQAMVDCTQFPEKISDLNYASEQYIVTSVELKDDYDITSMTGDAIRALRNLEIETRIAQSQLEENSISVPLLNPGEISIASANGAEARFDSDLTLTDMNLDEIKLRAEDNAIEVTCCQLITHSDWGTSVQGQIKRPFSISEPRRKSFIKTTSDPFADPTGTEKPDALDAVVDPLLDRLWIPISRNGRVDMLNDPNDLKGKDFELTYQYRVNQQEPFVEQLSTCGEYSDFTLYNQGSNGQIELPTAEQFSVKRMKVEQTTGDDGTVQFNITSSDFKVKSCVDINPFRPIEARYVTIRDQNEADSFVLQKDSLFNQLNELLGLNTDFFASLYQDIVEKIQIDPLETDRLGEQAEKQLDQDITADTVQDISGGDNLDQGNPPTDQELQNLKNKLQNTIASNQLGFISSDKIINQAFVGPGVDAGVGDTPLLPPLGPLWRFTTGTLVDGHDRMIKEPFTFERVNFQMRHASGMFMNVDRRGSINVNANTFLLNTVGMSLYSGYAHRTIDETRVADKFGDGGDQSSGAQLDKKIYLPEPIPTNTKNQAGRVLNIDQKKAKDSKGKPIDQGSDPRDRTPSKDTDPHKFVRSDIGQIPSISKDIMPPPDAPALGPETDPASKTGAPGDPAAPSSDPAAKNLQNFIPRDGSMDPTDGGSPEPAGSSSSGGGGFGPSMLQTDRLQAEAPKGDTPITFLNELQIKIPKTAKIKPYNDITDPAIIGYDKPRTKELDLYSFQTDKLVLEAQPNGKTLKDESIDWDQMSRPAAFIEISAANLIDRDGTIIRSSMTQKAIAFDFSMNIDDTIATTALDQVGNIDATHNNIYHRFNAGFMEYGIAQKIKRQDEEVEVRLESEDQGKVSINTNPNDIAKKVEAKLDKVRRQAIIKNPYKRLGHLSFKVNVKADEGIQSEVKTPKEIEKEKKAMKVEKRMLRAPVENIPKPDVELEIGAVVEGNHTETVTEAIGFKNKTLHYRVRKFVNEADISAFQDGLNKIATQGDSSVIDNITSQMQSMKASAKTAADFEKIEAIMFAVIDALDAIAVQITGPTYTTNLTEGPTTNTQQIVYNKADQTVNQKKQADATKNELEQQKLQALIDARKALNDLFHDLFPDTTDPDVLAAQASAPRDISSFFPNPNTTPGPGAALTPPSGLGQNGIPFPVGFGQNPAGNPKAGTTLIHPNTDPRFPSGAVLGFDGTCVGGQGAFASGQLFNPSTGLTSTGSAYASGSLGGGVTIAADGSLVPPAVMPQYPRLSPIGVLTTRPIDVPMGTAVGPNGCIQSFPNPGTAGSPNNNAPLNLTRFFSERSLAKEEITLEPTKAIKQIENSVITRSVITPNFAVSKAVGADASVSPSAGSSTNSPTFAPANANQNASNASLFGNSSTQSDPGGANGGAAGASDNETIVDIDRAGNWECRLGPMGTSQIMINPIAQFQIGHVIDKDGSNNIVDARSLKGPLTRARLSVNNGPGMDLDAAGNFIGYATNDLLLKANMIGEVRSYDDLKLISDFRNVIIQAQGNPPLTSTSSSGDLSGGLTTTPPAEIVLGRLEHRGGPTEGSAIKNILKNETRAAMVCHLSDTDRSSFSLDKDGNSIIETTVDKTILLKSPQGELQLGKVVDIQTGNVANSDAGNPDIFRVLLANGAKLEIDNAGNAIISVPGKIILQSQNDDIDIKAPSGSVHISSSTGSQTI